MKLYTTLLIVGTVAALLFLTSFQAKVIEGQRLLIRNLMTDCHQ